MRVLTFFMIALAGMQSASCAEPRLDFVRDVRPILASNCFPCHGPDQQTREADLRLDLRSGALAELPSGVRAIVPFDPRQSELVRRIASPDAAVRMPPDEPLTRSEIELINTWIAQGAPWQEHWAFAAPTRPSIPAVSNHQWPRNEIDYFVLARLERAGLEPSPFADAATRIRRVSFDLTGLPPTPEEIDEFQADTSPAAYERYVERLLSSPRYGERMASVWMDAARYADTNGYQHDNGRDMWPWRDWVISALNAGMPFDQFTIEQLAGDLLPSASDQTRIATGFNRNHGINFEGGSIDEESRIAYVADRANTLGTIWLGLTVGCAQCHDHKYDPLSQAEYYGLFAFFNNVDERGFAGEKGNAAPTMSVPWPEHDRAVAEAERQWQTLDDRLRWREAQRDERQIAWENAVGSGQLALPGPPDDANFHCAFDGRPADGEYRLTGAATFGEGRAGQAIDLDGRSLIEFANQGDFERDDEFSYGCWLRFDESQSSPFLAKAHFHGYDLCLEHGHLTAHLVHRWDINAIFVKTKEPLSPGPWRHVMVTYNGLSRAEGVSIYVDGQRQEIVIEKDDLTGTIRTETPLCVGGRNAETEGRFEGAIDEVQVFARCLSADEVALLADRAPIREILDVPPPQRTSSQNQMLRQFYLRRHDPEYLRSLADRDQARLRYLTEKDKQLTAMVMSERAGPPRVTHRLLAGRYDRPGEIVAPHVPSFLPPLQNGEPLNRLGLARWLVDGRNPLTARVAANRDWQLFFGAGLVRTAEDFGTQGELPSHPELLDWLATQLAETGWDVKALQRLIVTSATYQQSSAATRSPSSSVDPENRLLARAPRFRLPAEMLRDAALHSSGLLVERLGGPSVLPHQPADLWSELSFQSGHTAQEYVPSGGAGLYRREMYTFWKRTCPPPGMQVFDAPDRNVCHVRRESTNTPLQALFLLNDASYVDAARSLAIVSLNRFPDSPAGQLRHAFRAVLSRPPTDWEFEQLTTLRHEQQRDFAHEVERARQFNSIGQMKSPADIDPADLAALTSVVQVLMSTDEAISRN